MERNSSENEMQIAIANLRGKYFLINGIICAPILVNDFDNMFNKKLFIKCNQLVFFITFLLLEWATFLLFLITSGKNENATSRNIETSCTRRYFSDAASVGKLQEIFESTLLYQYVTRHYEIREEGK